MQWDTSTHDWLEGRGETIYLISMIDDATSRLFARFVRHDTSQENMRLLWSYLERFGPEAGRWFALAHGIDDPAVTVRRVPPRLRAVHKGR